MSDSKQEKNGTPVAEEAKSSPGSNYGWILDENLLRDEGVIYGLSDSSHVEKTETIRRFYQEKISALRVEEGILQERREELLRKMEEVNACIAALHEAVRGLSTKTLHVPNAFYRYLALLMAYSAMVIFTFGAIYEWVGQSWRYPVLVSLGVYIFGGFSLYYQTSVVYEPDGQVLAESGREKWKTYLEEFAVPLVAALFIVLWGDPVPSLPKTISFGLLIYFLFLFSGKGLLKSFYRLLQEVHLLRENVMSERFRKRLLEEKTSETTRTEAALGNLRVAVEVLEKDLAYIQIKAKRHEEEAETRVAYFLSEFALAKAAKDALSAEQLIQLGTYHNR